MVSRTTLHETKLEGLVDRITHTMLNKDIIQNTFKKFTFTGEK